MNDVDLDALATMNRCAAQLSTRAEQLLTDIAQLEQLLACLKAAVLRISGEQNSISAGNLLLVKATH